MSKKPFMNFSSGEKVRANISTKVNASQIRREKRDGRDVVIVPSFTLPDDVIMNGILYPAAEIEKSYKTLIGTPAPLGHPTVNGMFVPALSPLGLNIGYFGAWNATATRIDGRVFLEKVIDVERANENEMGRRVIGAIGEGRPIHTSTGLIMNIRECTTSDLADWEGFDMEFDHDAILLDEQGAATPEQGVGMLVNGNRLAVINSTIEQDLAQEVEWMAESLVRSVERAEERMEDAPLIQRIKSALLEAIGLARETETEENGDIDMTDGVKKDEFDALAKKVDGIVSSVEEVVNKAIEPLANGLKEEKEAREAAAEAAEQAAKAELVNKVVELKLLGEDEAKKTPDSALKALINSAKPKGKPAPGINAGYSGSDDKTFDLAEDWEKE